MRRAVIISIITLLNAHATILTWAASPSETVEYDIVSSMR